MHEPAVLGGDLNARDELAFEEGHDADMPNGGNEKGFESVQTRSAPSSGMENDLEKGDARSSHTSISGGAVKVQPDMTVTAVEPSDPNVVFWEGEDDPENPMNWTNKAKWSSIAMLSIITLITPLASSMFAPGVPQCMADFKSTSETLAAFVVSVYLLGFCFGPLIIAPLSEMYGRLIIYHVCNVGFLIFTIACAVAPTLNALIIFRFFAGCFGAAPLTIGGGSIADCMHQTKRGGAMAIWAMGPLLGMVSTSASICSNANVALGPVIGPVAGGFLAKAKGWRWIFWLLTMLAGCSIIGSYLFLRETHAPTLLAKKVKKMQKETGNKDLRSKLDSGLTPKDLFLRSIVRPTKMLCCSPIVAAMSIYMAVVYGMLYLLFTTFTYVFEENYGFTESTVGLVYIGCGAGMIIGLVILGTISDPLIKRLSAKNGGVMKPEYRLPPVMVLGFFIPVGLFIYGWTAQYHIQWAVPLLGTLFVGVGLIAAFMCVQTYLVDAFTIYAASALAANTVLRSIFGAVLPLAGLKMYAVLGLGWGNSLLGFVSLALIPIPYVFFIYGERIRTHPRFQISL